MFLRSWMWPCPGVSGAFLWLQLLSAQSQSCVVQQSATQFCQDSPFCGSHTPLPQLSSTLAAAVAIGTVASQESATTMNSQLLRPRSLNRCNLPATCRPVSMAPTAWRGLFSARLRTLRSIDTAGPTTVEITRGQKSGHDPGTRKLSST